MRALVPLALTASLLPAQNAPFVPDVAEASGAAERALQTLRPATGLDVDLVAAEPDLANVIAFDIDRDGRFWVAESHRLRRGVFDMREHVDWIDRDLACRTVEDRVAMMREWLGDAIGESEIAAERIRVLTVAADGAVESRVFADGFDDLAHGLAAGVLVDGDDVWFTCLPELWRLRDRDGDGAADERTAVHRGFGVRFQFIGHDMHGLRIGPDRRLYWSIGDRGLHVNDTVTAPECGAVLRCELDGSGLELFATGLRNPQELAFDAHGNLFTGDNNGDGGDRARWVYVVEGGDSGWRCGYQWMPDRGPWNRDALWHPHHAAQPAWIVPPVMNIAHGPSGLTYYPATRGTPLADRLGGTFLLCDYRATPTLSGVLALAFTEHGAGFELTRRERLLWSVCATDVEVGYDGDVYVTDWVEGWGLSRRGRIYRVRDARTEPRSAGATRTDAGLRSADMRERLRAQFALVDRGAVEELTRIAHEPTPSPARLHAVWGLGILARADVAVCGALRDLLDGGDAELVAQAAKVLGEARDAESADRLAELTRHANSRVRFFACQALGKTGGPRHVAALLDTLRHNADRDAFLRHGAVMGLAGIGDADALRAAIADESEAVRRGVLLALTRLRDAEVAAFLRDPVDSLVHEAARAIYRESIGGALPALAAQITRPDLDDVELGLRVLHANSRLGTAAAARALTAFARRTNAPSELRRVALTILGDWTAPPSRDPVVGGWRPLPPRADATIADRLLDDALPDLVRDADDAVGTRAAEIAGARKRSAATPALEQVARDRGRAATRRAAALTALGALNAESLDGLLDAIDGDDPVPVREASVRLFAERAPAKAVPLLASLCENAERRERQNAMLVLGGMPEPAAGSVVLRFLERLTEGDLEADMALEVLEAADARAGDDPAIAAALNRYRESRDDRDALAAHRVSLVGGDAKAGYKVFAEHRTAQCTRCHRVGAQGGAAGPVLDGIGARHPREYLLTSLVNPNAAIADGYAMQIVNAKDGSVHVGVQASESETTIEIVDAAGQSHEIAKADIESRTSQNVSSMPPMAGVLTPRELRDLIEYLASLEK